jgi:hypothetical protein
MEIVKTKGKMKEGQVILDSPQHNLPTDTEVEVIIIVKGKSKQSEFEEARKDMQKAFQEAGIESREQVLDLIRDVKKELFEERIRNHQAFFNGYAPEDEGLYDNQY